MDETLESVTLIADPRVLSVPIRECGEPLVDLRELPAVAIDERKRDPAGTWLFARGRVAERLGRAQAACPAGIRLLLVEAYRPVALQERYFREYVAQLAGEHPDWDDETLRARASRYVAPGDDHPPHSTGGAIDLSLADAHGQELDLGTPINASPERSRGACYTAASGLSARAQANRRLLVDLMTAAGFVNYATEWWHWSFGDRYWAFESGAAVAEYGATSPPVDVRPGTSAA